MLCTWASINLLCLKNSQSSFRIRCFVFNVWKLAGNEKNMNLCQIKKIKFEDEKVNCGQTSFYCLTFLLIKDLCGSVLWLVRLWPPTLYSSCKSHISKGLIIVSFKYYLHVCCVLFWMCIPVHLHSHQSSSHTLAIQPPPKPFLAAAAGSFLTRSCTYLHCMNHGRLCHA